MIQSLQSTNFIGKRRLAHDNPIFGILRSICQNASLRKQFADISTGVVIPVYNQSTGLTNIGFVNFSRFIQSSASATEPRSMIRINLVKRDNIFFTQAGQGMKEFSIRNFINNLINFFSFGISEFSSSPQIFQIFNDNISISKRFAQINYLMSKFPATIFDKIVFISFQSSKRFESLLASQISKSLKFGLSSFNNLSFDKHLFSKIKVPKKFLFLGIVNRNSNIISIGIYSNNILAFNRFVKILFDEDLNFEVFEDKDGTNIPTTNQVFNQSQISTILNDRKINSFAFCISCNRDNKQALIIGFYAKHSFVKSDWNADNFITDFSSQKNLEQRSLNKGRLQFILFSEIFVNHRLKFISANSLIFSPDGENFLRTGKIFIIQFREFSSLSNCRFSYIDCNYLLHFDNNYNNNLFINVSNPQFIPNLNKFEDRDFLREG